MGYIYLIFAIISSFLIINQIYIILAILAFIVSIYNFYNRIIGKKHPYKICFNQDSIEFYAKDKIDSFDYEEIKKFYLKQYSIDVETYLWIQTIDNQKNKFYINLSKFENNKELLDELLKLKTN
ncbi:hypothetical protein AB9Q04_02590 [Anaerococcus sp. ENR1011]|uniref:Uncharacterized protein n=1 Tax=Anaerococcus groningensis TaxID=3115616 RepID=A0ABW9MZF9_9FIRM